MQEDRAFSGQVVDVELGANSYHIYVGADILPELGRFVERTCGRCRVIMVSDQNVARLYGQTVEKILRQSGGEVHQLKVAPGESSKRMAVVERLYDQLFDFSVERTDALVALGGGVVGDLAGFVAATFKRGIKYVQVPTSLLAMVDSSIGGKTGINHPRGKNMIGSFHQPKLVLADTAVLETLPRRELGCGLAETVKHAVIRDGSFFELLEQNSGAIMKLQGELLSEVVAWNCRIKAQVVSADEREAGLRRILNFGHTIGHVIETVMADRDFHHGEAVSLGMVAAAGLAVKRGMLTAAQCERIVNLLKVFDLPVVLTGDIPTEQLYRAMQQDKKVEAGKIVFVLPTAIGACTMVDDLSEAEITAAIESLGAPKTG